MEQEVQRLEWQVFVLGDAEIRVLDELGLPWVGRALEVGCGTGGFAARLMGLRPGLEVSGLDIEPPDGRGALARQRLGGRYQVHDATSEGGLPCDDPYDLVYARLALRHMAQPDQVIRRMMAAARPGGRVILMDADDGMLTLRPPCAGLDGAVAAAHGQRTARSPGAIPVIGPRLPALAHEAGLLDLQVRVLTLGTEQISAGRFRRLLEPFCDPRNNGMTPDACDSVRAELDRWALREDAFACWSMVYVGGKVPGPLER